MNNRELYFAESPFQLLSALEAIYYYKPSSYVLVIRYANQSDAKQLKNMIHLLKLDTSYLKIIDGSSTCKVRKYFNESAFLIWMLLYHKKYSRVYLGTTKSRYLNVVRDYFLKEKKIIYLDDGSASLVIQDSFTDSHSFDYFTMFEMVAFKNQSIITHNFEYFHTQLGIDVIPKKSTVVILGNKFYEAGMLSREDSEYLLKKIMDDLGNEDVLYVAHRGESKEKLYSIQKEHKLDVVQYDFPIELYALYKKELPKQVVSLFSTALFSLSKIYPDLKVTAYKMNTNKLLDHSKNYKELYDVYADYIEIIDIT